MLRLALRRPGGAQVFELGLNALDREADGAAAGEAQFDGAGGIGGGFEADVEQFQHALLGSHVDAGDGDVGDPGEAERRAPPLTVAAAAADFPGIAVHQHGEAFVAHGVAHVGHPEHRILGGSRNDFEVVAVERKELEIGHRAVPVAGESG